MTTCSPLCFEYECEFQIRMEIIKGTALLYAKFASKTQQVMNNPDNASSNNLMHYRI